MYTVTRQAQWMGDLMVEISGGGFDYVNPDMLSPKYNNGGETFGDPRDAVNAAIEIYNMWRKDEPSEDIYIGYGDTLGFTIPFEASCIPEIKEWSQKEYDDLPKCDRCGDILPDELLTEFEEANEEDKQYIFEDIFDHLNEIAPDGLMFCAQDSDGACYGFWNIEDDI